MNKAKKDKVETVKLDKVSSSKLGELGAPNTSDDRSKASHRSRPRKDPTSKKLTHRFKLKTFSWSLAMLAWVAIALIASQYIILYIMVAILGVQALSQPVWVTVYTANAFVLCLALVIVVPWRLLKIKTNREELGLSGLPTWTDIGLTPVGFIVFWIASMLVLALFMTIFPSVNWEQAQDVGFRDIISTSDKLLAFAALVIFAPIAEEIIFRGWLYGKFRVKLPAWISILLVSALFGAMHMQWGAATINDMQWNVAINVACMSVVMCLLREITGTIWSSILLHMLKNGIAFYFLFINSTLIQ